jgi:predicted small secreted protein
MIKSLRASALAKDSNARRHMALLGLAVLMIGGLMLSGCNTTAGAGQDVKATGSAITRSADSVKDKL